MHVTVCPSPTAASAHVVRRMAAALRHRPSLVLSLPTGRTPIEVYEGLARLATLGRIDVSRVVTFNLDEFVGLRPNDSRSYRAFMDRHLFQPLGIPRRRGHVLNGSARDPAAECARFERAIASAGGIDVQLLGIGLNGHLGFNEPGPDLVAATHKVTLTALTRRANVAWFGGDARRVPREALTMGIGTILRARRIILLATGRAKARVVRRAIEGRITTWVPASLLQLHADVEVVLDRDAASRLGRASRAPRRGVGYSSLTPSS